MENVILTGANGFIGSHIVKVFSEKGIHLGCLVRKQSNVNAIKDLNVEFTYGDICDYASLVKAFRGAQCVIHNAAYAKDWGEYKTFYQINVEGTLNVLKASAAVGIQDVIITGTNAVYGEENSSLIKNEDSPYNSHYPYFLDRIFPCKFNYYRDTKSLATQKAIEFAKGRGMNLTVIEPVWVYGEHGKDTIFIEYLRAVEQGAKWLPGSKKNKFHVVYAGDLAEAFYLAFCKRLTGINRIIIGDQVCAHMDTIFSLFCEYAHLQKPNHLPKWLAYPIGFIWELIYTLFDIKKAPFLTRGRVNTFYDSIEYSTEKAKRMVGFQSRHSLRQGIKKTVAWYKGEAFVHNNNV